MAENVTLNPVVTFSNDTTAVNLVNGNNTTITNAFVDVLSRAGNSPNQMLSNLDMNNNQVLNLPPPGSINSPARLIDVTSSPIISSVPPTGTSGAVVGFLNGNNTVSGNNTYSGTSTFTNTITLPTTTAGNTTFSGSNTFGGTQTFSNPFVIPANSITRAELAQGPAKSVMGVTGNATANVADIVPTNTRQVLTVSGPGAGTSLIFAQPQGDQLLGTITNDSATTGNVGEYISSSISIGSAVTLGTNTAANVTSISLTAGDWDVSGSVYYSLSGASTAIVGGITTTSATQASSPGQFYQINYPSTSYTVMSAPTATFRLSLASTTVVYLTALCIFSTGATTAYGFIGARRAR